MNTPIKFEIAKLLKEKGFDLPMEKYYVDKNTCVNSLPAKIDGTYPTNNDLIMDWCSAPTIAEVVMWLYEKHEIWIEVSADNDCEKFQYVISDECSEYNCKSPTEAYEAAIEYTLKNLI